MSLLPYSEACERNKEPILTILQSRFSELTTVVEIGSGTAQHAVYFAGRLPHLTWQTTDQFQYVKGINARLEHEGPDNVLAPLILDVAKQPWPVSVTDATFSANTLHIMSPDHVVHFFKGCGQILKRNGLLCVYGPFKYNGEFTSASNARFDQSLQAGDLNMGIRDFELVNELAEAAGLQLLDDIKMPANNQMLIWKKL